MSNWVIQNFIYNFNPSIYNYIKFKWYHFRFCSKDDPTISAALYLENLLIEVAIELTKETTVNKKSLALAAVTKILENIETKNQMMFLFEKKDASIKKEEIKQFLNKVSLLMHNRPSNFEEPSADGEPLSAADFPVRTYVIATHIYLEINNNELHYETLIRDTTALKEFISAKFKLSRIPGRIEEMKNFSYKKILQSKSAVSAKGQLIPQIRQIAVNPEIFGKDVSAFAENILKEHSAIKK
ncbi:hypothetical protein [Segetibacter koreensis]|uniref:hypothetical protein n=1 Tax=Segetibacter koreensis TaxID=398037 RepID=UPI00037B25F1|nr:hypothetical protein [Segetibacter koreensis]